MSNLSFPSKQKLWYSSPANYYKWTEALPIGNGRLGGMIFGGTGLDKIQLNEDSLWYGGPQRGDNPDARHHLPDIKKLIAEGRIGEAEHLARMALLSTPKYFPPYQPLGELLLWTSGTRSASDYRRELDLETGMVGVRYKAGGFRFERTYFCSAFDQVMVVRLETDCPDGLVTSLNLMRRPFDDGSRTIGTDTLVLKGQAGNDGVQFCCVVKALPDDGQAEALGDFISLKGTRAATLLLAAGTTYRHEDPEQVCLERIAAAAGKRYAALKQAHIAEYRQLYSRVSLHIADPAAEAAETLPTDQRLLRFKEGEQDHGLITLYYQYGRYLLLASSRPGSLPCTLQGIWNDQFTPPWESKYTINLNIQMNYWPAETGNLAECHEPLFDLIDRMRPNGRKTAQLVYGCRGFVAHHNTNLWGETQIEGVLVAASIWPMGGAWLTLHMWEHYCFNPDIDFLQTRAFPAMKEAAEFFLDYMSLNEQGYLVTGPSLSPENRYRLPNGETGSLCMGPVMDIQIVRHLYEACLEACSILGEEHSEFCAQLNRAYRLLPPNRIGKHGQLMEWQEDYEEAEPGHRHMSHLYALYPGHEISPYYTPDWTEAAKRTIERRLKHGAGGNGWSRSWMINFFARLNNGNEAYRHLRHLLADSTYLNLFDSYPPFQIDGNLGATAGIQELLLQSQRGELILLPALPDAWQSGEARGLRARGGFEIDIAWKGGALDYAEIRADKNGICRIRTRLELDIREASERVAAVRNDDLLEFAAIGGKSYTVTNKT